MNNALVAQVVLLAEEGVEDVRVEIDAERRFPHVDTEWWRRLGDPMFKSHFRMDRRLFEILLVTVGQRMVATGRILRAGMALDVSLMMTLWILATNDSFRSTGVHFGCDKGSVHNQYRTLIEVISELRGLFICWPSLVELGRIARYFEERYGYLSVGGCVDGCHLRTTAPLVQPQRYINRHHDYSMILQGICDHRLLFRDIFLGQPGAVGDLRTFDRSSIGRRILRQDDLLGEYHLLGDGAYILTEKLLTPYRDLGNLTRRQRTHNYILSRCRSTIERAFALLKGKWRRLKYFQVYSMQYAIESMMSCIVLHNFILLEGVAYEDEYMYNGRVVLINITDEELLEESKIRGTRKREFICALLNQE